MEIKQFALTEVKADDDARTIEGLGSVYGNVDGGNDIVLPGAFAKCIARMKSEGTKPRMLWQHKTDTPVGVWDFFEESNNALVVKGKIIDTTVGMDAYKLVKGGAINGLSIGYGVKDYSIDAKSGTRLLKELELYEVSLVTFPMNEKAIITAVKSASDDIDTAVMLLNQAMAMCQAGGDGGMQPTPEMTATIGQIIASAIALLNDPNEGEGEGEMSKPDERTLEKHLRDAGFSRTEAKTIISGGYKALTQRDADDALHLLAERMDAFAASLQLKP